MKKEKERQRKADIKHGETTQKMMSFRLDNDLVESLKSVANKGRLINELIREWKASKNVDESEQDTDPESKEKDYNQA